MASRLIIGGFEHGCSTTLFASSTYPGIFNAGLGSAGGFPEISSTRVHSGNYAFHIPQVGGACWGAWDLDVAPFSGTLTGEVVFRGWIYLEALPVSDCQIMQFETATGSINLRLGVASDGEAIVTIGTDSAVYKGIYFSADTWHAVDVLVDTDQNPWTFDFKIDGTAASQTTSARAADNVDRIYFGSPNIQTLDRYFDDCQVSLDAADYPLPDITVLGMVPTGDGTHNNPTSLIARSSGGTTPAYDHLNTLGGSLSTYMYQISTNTSNYVEVTFPTPAGSPTVVASRVYLALSAATTLACDSKCYISDDSFSTQDTVWSGDPSYSTSVLAWGGTMLSNAHSSSLSGLKARWGYSADASPDPESSLILVEYAVEVSADQEVTPGVIARAGQVFAPTVLNPQTVDAPAKLGSAGQVFAPSRIDQSLSPGQIVQAGQVFAPSRIDQSFALGLIANTGQAFAPTVDQSVVMGAISNTGQIFAPRVDQSVVMGLIDRSGQVYDPMVVPDAADQQVTIGALLDQSGQVFAPTVDQSATIGLLSYPGQLFAPASVQQQVSMGLISQPGQTFAPLVKFDQNVTVGLIDASGQIFAPRVDQQVVVALIAQPGQVFAPRADQQVALGLIAQPGQLFAPRVDGGAEPSLIANVGQLFAPRVDQQVQVGLINNIGAVYGPSAIREGRVEPDVLTSVGVAFAPTVNQEGTPTPVTGNWTYMRRRPPTTRSQ